MLTVDSVRMARKPMYFSSEKARRELGYTPRPAVEALRDEVEWFYEHAMLSERKSRSILLEDFDYDLRTWISDVESAVAAP